MTELLCIALTGYYIVLLAYVVLSWVPRPPEPFLPFFRVVRGAVDPVVTPIRRVLPPLQLGGVGLDLSVLVLFFGLVLVRGALGCG